MRYDLLMSEGGIRERKKERTRRAIEQAALRLFAERGYAETTISEIADEAEIARRTFFSYFPTKEDLVVADFARFIDAYEARMEARDPAQDFLTTLKAWLVEYAATEVRDHERREMVRALVLANPELRARERFELARAERITARHVAADLGERPDDVRPRFVAAALTATIAALGEARDGQSQADRAAEAHEHVDDVFTFLEGGLEALRRRDAAGGRVSRPLSP